MYGTSGNSFVAVVEFGDQVRARAVTAGGESGDPKSPHFNDQAERYATGDLREVYFYRQQLKGTRSGRTGRENSVAEVQSSGFSGSGSVLVQGSTRRPNIQEH